MVSYITWRDSYSVGDESLDAHRKQLVDIINELYGAIQKGVEGKAVKILLDRLVQWTIKHFSYEEQVLLAYQYPDLAEHKALHTKMRRQAVALRDNANIVTGHELLRLLKEWWCNHILHRDKEYAPYLTGLVEV
jgi:hemerythrin-like metal-binding protein